MIWSSVFINEVEWDALETKKNKPHRYVVHSGANNQSNVNEVFDEKVCNYRGVAVTEFDLVKNDEIKSLSNINVIGHFQKCILIGSGGSSPTRSWTRNPAQILWDWYIDVEKYDYTDLDRNAFKALETYCGTYPSNGIGTALSPIALNGSGVTASSET